jgi:hypothetical protein
MFEGPILHIPPPPVLAYSNGAIRSSAGRLLAFFDYEHGLLFVSGIPEAFHCADLEIALAIVEERCPSA